MFQLKDIEIIFNANGCGIMFRIYPIILFLFLMLIHIGF